MATETPIKTIGLPDVERRIAKPAPFHFWNVLTDYYFTGPMIPRSRRVPLDRIGREVRATELPKDAEIIVYCSSYACPMSTSAARKLEKLGYTNVRAYEGGVKEWREAGLPLEHVEPVPVEAQ